MNVRCPACEVRQAKAIAFVMLFLKRTPEEVCTALSVRYGVRHFVDVLADGDKWSRFIVRDNSASPHNPTKVRRL